MNPLPGTTLPGTTVPTVRTPSSPGLTELVARLRSGDLALTDWLAGTAERFAAAEPEVRAFVPEPERFARLAREAAALAARYPDPRTRPPLYGVLFGVKDIFHVDGFTTHAGSRLPAAELQGSEAVSVSTLKAAGALVLGKAVSTEFAYFAPGPTRNPHHLGHTPGGSSSGSAAAVAAGLCPLALGTQTIGSLTRPAAFCGVVAYKPSFGRIATQGVIPLAPSLDHVGYFTTDVAGAALVASVLVPDWRGTLPPRRAVCGVPAGPYLERANVAAREHFQAVCTRLGACGWTVRPLPALEDIVMIEARHRQIVAAEAAHYHQRFYPRLAEFYQPQTVDLLERGLKVSAADLAVARAGRLVLRQELSAAMDQHGLDLWLSPAAPGAALPGLGATGDPIMNLPWTHAGLPTLGVPSGRDAQGLPLGIQLAARFGADEELLGLGQALMEDLG